MARDPWRYYHDTASDTVGINLILTAALTPTDRTIAAATTLTAVRVKTVCYEGKWRESISNNHIAAATSRWFHLISAQYAERLKAQSGTY